MTESPVWLKELKIKLNGKSEKLVRAFEFFGTIFDDKWFKKESEHASQNSPFEPFRQTTHSLAARIQVFLDCNSMELIWWANLIGTALPFEGAERIIKQLKNRNTFYSTIYELEVMQKIKSLGNLTYGDSNEQRPDWKLLLDDSEVFIEVKRLSSSLKQSTPQSFTTLFMKELGLVFPQRNFHINLNMSDEFLDLCNVFVSNNLASREDFINVMAKEAVGQLMSKLVSNSDFDEFDWLGLNFKKDEGRQGSSVTLYGPDLKAAHAVARVISSLLRKGSEQTKACKRSIITVQIPGVLDFKIEDMLRLMAKSIWADSRYSHVSGLHFRTFVGDLAFVSPNLKGSDLQSIEQVLDALCAPSPEMKKLIKEVREQVKSLK